MQLAQDVVSKRFVVSLAYKNNVYNVTLFSHKNDAVLHAAVKGSLHM